jgi:hypothetical protein
MEEATEISIKAFDDPKSKPKLVSQSKSRAYLYILTIPYRNSPATTAAL